MGLKTTKSKPEAKEEQVKVTIYTVQRPLMLHVIGKDVIVFLPAWHRHTTAAQPIHKLP